MNFSLNFLESTARVRFLRFFDSKAVGPPSSALTRFHCMEFCMKPTGSKYVLVSRSKHGDNVRTGPWYPLRLAQARGSTELLYEYNGEWTVLNLGVPPTLQAKRTKTFATISMESSSTLSKYSFCSAVFLDFWKQSRGVNTKFAVLTEIICAVLRNSKFSRILQTSGYKTNKFCSESSLSFFLMVFREYAIFFRLFYSIP